MALPGSHLPFSETAAVICQHTLRSKAVVVPTKSVKKPGIGLMAGLDRIGQHHSRAILVRSLVLAMWLTTSTERLVAMLSIATSTPVPGKRRIYPPLVILSETLTLP